MAPAPLCKTAILRFLVGQDIVPRLWNVSSNARKRLQMVFEEMEITLREYDKKALKIKEWVRVGKNGITIDSIEEIKKGVSNYVLETQEQADRVVSLNGKLRCHKLCFKPVIPVEFDYIEDLALYLNNYYTYSKCSFNKVGTLRLVTLLSDQIQETATKLKQIKTLQIEHCSISNLDLSSFNNCSILFDTVTFSGEVKLPFHSYSLSIFDCKNANLLKCNKATKLNHCRIGSKESYEWLKSARGVRQIEIGDRLSNCIDFIPNTTRVLGGGFEFDSENIGLPVIKSKFPFLIKVERPISVETAQALNLRSIYPKLNKTKEKLAYRPREIEVDSLNVEELNKHPELFEKVEKVGIDADNFNYDCLPDGIKEIRLNLSSVKGQMLDNFVKNNWKFENTTIDVSSMIGGQAEKILNSLKKARKIIITWKASDLIEDYPEFRFITK